MLNVFRSKKNATQAISLICLLYGNNALDVCACQRRFDLDDYDYPGRPTEANDSLLEEFLKKDS